MTLNPTEQNQMRMKINKNLFLKMLHKIFNELFALNVFVARELILNAFNILACGNCQTVQVVNSKKKRAFPEQLY